MAQADEDQAQGRLLTSLLAPDPDWEVQVVLRGTRVVGFVAVRMDRHRRVGEIGLNAVDPAHAGRGIGTAMYRFAVRRMRAAGMKVATVATGGDESHEPARRAYRKAGFDAEVPSVWMCMDLARRRPAGPRAPPRAGGPPAGRAVRRGGRPRAGR